MTGIQRAELRDHFFREPVAEEFLLGVVAQILKRQHRQRGARGSRRRRTADPEVQRGEDDRNGEGAGREEQDDARRQGELTAGWWRRLDYLSDCRFLLAGGGDRRRRRRERRFYGGHFNRGAKTGPALRQPPQE